VEISTLILAVVIQAGIVLVFNDSAKIMHPIVPGVWRVGGATVTYNILTATVASWVILFGLFLFVRKTHVGRAISAVSMDIKGAALSGINPDRINMITWGISGALGAIAGVFFASYTQLSPNMWVAPLIIAVAVVIVGGIGSIIGTLIVAHIIGFMEIISTTLIAAELRGVFTMLLIIVVLVMMPKGLFGRGDL
ncbi:MAG: branched-chain amino acid ABC transporter permease, partial [Rhodobacteraceae bacterium]|nr:branched-chain amino acid ABC transporter permease [Paracoccaceae bacterium]